MNGLVCCFFQLRELTWRLLIYFTVNGILQSFSPPRDTRFHDLTTVCSTSRQRNLNVMLPHEMNSIMHGVCVCHLQNIPITPSSYKQLKFLLSSLMPHQSFTLRFAVQHPFTACPVTTSYRRMTTDPSDEMRFER